MPIPPIPIPIPIQSPAKLQDPVAAVTDPDPYPYYAELVASRPIYWEESTQTWVAASTEAVTAVLTNHLLRVRPTAEPVPKGLLGTPAENIFRHLVRMNDGAAHCPFKQAVAATLHAAASVHVEAVGSKCAQQLWREMRGEEIEPQCDLRRIADFALRLPAYVMASLLGIPEDKLPQTAQWTGEFVRCLAPAGRPEEIERGKVAAAHLLDLFRSLLASRHGLASRCGFASQPATPAGLLATLALEAKRVGEENLDVILANGIGFLTQAYEATAGLIGNTLLMLGTHHDVLEQIKADRSLLENAVEETLRYDAPVQNTRRFAAHSGIIAGQPMSAGDTVLVLLAAANRDPAANPNPEKFDIHRKNRRIFTFGAGVHACPGEAFAKKIAQAGVAQLLESGVDPRQLAATVTYRPSANTRVPIFVDAN
ncbi:MAG TPA: cytochrome P450 [Terriglobales bacterium]|jgi:cytochrome P450|nr:cytochrome P450 [Terriglobales bacterium]